MFNIGEYSLYGDLVSLNYAPVMSVQKKPNTEKESCVQVFVIGPLRDNRWGEQ